MKKTLQAHTMTRYQVKDLKPYVNYTIATVLKDGTQGTAIIMRDIQCNLHFLKTFELPHQCAYKPLKDKHKGLALSYVKGYESDINDLMRYLK